MLNGSFSNYVPDCLRGMPPPHWVRQAGHPGLCSAYLSWVMSKPCWSPCQPPFAFVSLFPFSSLSHPFFATLQRCLLPSFPSADIRGCSYFCAGAGSREPGLPPSAHGPACLSPYLCTLPNRPGIPSSLQPSCLLIPGFPVRAPGGWGTVSPPGRAEGGLGPTLLQPWPAQPGPSSSAYISVLSHFSHRGAGRERM